MSAYAAADTPYHGSPDYIPTQIPLFSPASAVYWVMRWLSGLSVVVSVLLFRGSAVAATLKVGPGQPHAAPCAAFAAAQDGDTIEIDSAGSYAGDVCAIGKSRLLIRGAGPGRAHIDAAGKNAQGKAIWVVQGNDTTIENVELSGASVPDANGAGIRQEGKNLSVRNCSFHDNQDGILAGDVAGSEILIEYSEFDHNGAGDGYSHNLYINHVAKLTFQYNYSHRAVVGHLLKTRAAENHILYNRLTGESDGTQSYEIDCPNGGLTYVIGNLIEQGTTSENPALLAYMEEGAHAQNPSDALFVVNNSFVNHLGRGTFVSVGAAATTPALLSNNVFFGGGTACSQASAIVSHNYDGKTSCFVADSTFDFHLVQGSPCIDAGADPGTGAGRSLLPSSHYVHPAASEPRPVSGIIDVGAFEFAATTASGGAAATGGNASGGAATTATGGATSTGGNASGGSAGVASTGGSPARGGAAPSAGTAGDAAASGAPTSDGCGCRTRRNHGGDSLNVTLAVFAALLVARRRFCQRRERRDREQSRY